MCKRRFYNYFSSVSGVFLRRIVGFTALVAGLYGFALAPASAHEFWMLSTPPAVAVGETAHLSLNVGQNFVGEVIPFTRQYAIRLEHTSVKGSQNLLARVPADGNVGDFSVRLDQPGTHLFVYEGHPNRITLGADRFLDYLHLEGLDDIIASREAAGTAAMPAREQFRRFVKTLVDVGGQSDATYATRTGQRFEIMPVSNLSTARPGDRLQWQLLYEQKPLANILIKAWHLRGAQQMTIQTRTDADGKFAFELPYAGTWMLSAVHMIPAVDTTKDDWESLWGNLTFVLKAGL